MKKRTQKTVILLTVAAAARAFVAWWHHADLNADEAVAVYEAVSLAATGHDRTGAAWPLYFFNFGFGENVVYSYLLAGLFAVFGTHAVLAAVPTFALNTAAVIVFYALVRRWFGERTGFAAAMLLAVSPWHMVISRYAYNASLVPFFMFVGYWAFVAAIQDKRPIFFSVSVISFVIAMYAYGVVMMIFPVICLWLLWYYRKALRPHASVVVINVLAGFMLALPLLLYMVGELSGARSVLFADRFPQLSWTRDGMFVFARYSVPVSLLLLASHVTEILSLRHLFWDADFLLAPRHMALFWIWELPLLAWGAYVIVKEKYAGPWMLIAGLAVLGAIPTILVDETLSFPLRLGIDVGFGEIVAAAGLSAAVAHPRVRYVAQKYGRIIAIVFICGSLLAAVLLFMRPQSVEYEKNMQRGIAEAMAVLDELDDNVDRVVISDAKAAVGIFYYIFYVDYLWYHHYPPEDFQAIFAKLDGYDRGFFVPHIGNVEFCYAWKGCDVRAEYLKDPSALFMLRGDELTDIPAVREVYYADGTPAFRFLKTGHVE